MSFQTAIKSNLEFDSAQEESVVDDSEFFSPEESMVDAADAADAADAPDAPDAPAAKISRQTAQECTYCIEEICNEVRISDSESLCTDKTIIWLTNETLFKAFNPPAKNMQEFQKFIENESSARKVAIISDFGSALTSYLQTPAAQQNAHLKVALTRFIGRLLDVVEKEKKHACAGDQCSEPVNSDSFITFNDIAGADMEKQEIMNAFIYPMDYSSLFPTLSKGLLFYGPPGTGKSLLAKATAHYMKNAAFYAPTPSDFKGGLVGESEAKIKNVFECACQRVAEDPKYKQAIIFIDEFESIASNREGANTGVTSSAVTVPTLLQLMEGVQSDRLSSVSLMAATNLPWTLDPAILRRIPAKIFVDLPTRAAREFVVRKSLNDAFSKFLTKKEYDSLSSEDKYKGMHEDQLERVLPYIRNNFKIQAQNMERTGGVYQKMLEAANKNFDLDNFISMIVERTGPKPSSKEYRRFNNEDEKEYSDNAYSKYGYSLSDLDKAMDAIISDVGAQALRRAKVVMWDQYKDTKGLDDTDIPIFIQENYFFCISSSGVAGKSLASLTSQEKQKVISWELDWDRAFYVLKSRGSSINEKQYEDVVKYYLTGKAPDEE